MNRNIVLLAMKHIFIRLFFIITLLSPTVLTAGEHYSFRHIDNHHGLSANNVKCITQDHLGFMWFGTKNGLNRYDGTQIRRFDCFDTKLNRGNNNIGALYEDENSNLWIGTDRGIYIYNPHSDSINYVDRATPEGAVATNWVQRILGDRKGNVWALIPDEGLYRYSGNSTSHYDVTKHKSTKEVFPSDFCIDRNGNAWVVTAKAGMFRYDTGADRFIKVNPNGITNIDNILFCCICENDEGMIIMGAANGYVYCYNPSTNYLSSIKFSQGGRTYLRHIECFGDEIWIGTHNGLYIVNRSTSSETHLKVDNLNRFSLSDNIIYCIYRDANGGAWLGTMFGGVNFFPGNKFQFVNYGLGSNLSSNLIIGLACDISGDIWIGTENAGVNILNPKTSSIKQATHFPPSNNIVLSMAAYDGNVYTAFSRKGLIKTDANGNTSQTFPDSPNQDNNIYSYLIDSNGTEWVGQGFALYRKTKSDSKFRQVKDTGYDWIYHIFEASDGMIWFGTMGCGIWKYNPQNGSFKNYSHDHAATSPSGLQSNSINSIMEDSSGNIWVSTERGGLSKYNKDSDTFSTFSIADGLPDDCVYTVLEDQNKFLWFGTNKGLVRFSPSTSDICVFTCEDGLPGDQFNYKSAIRAADGKFYFGGINGIVSFVPEHYNNNVLPPIFTPELQYIDNDLSEYIERSILFADEITLNYNESTFAITISSPSYNHLGRESFSYRLLPANNSWIHMKSNEISFTNLSPGEYTLEVKVDNGMASNIRKLKITILPPWWKSSWANFIYVLIFIAIALIWFLWYRGRTKEKLHTFETNKEKEIYQSKINFFTEIAHEIRTPLTLIDLPLEAIEEIGVSNPDIKRYLKVSRQNTQRLLELTGQLLDFQKIESNKLTIKKDDINIINFITDIADRFEPTITISGKQLIRDLDSRPLSVSIDRDALTKIVSNLLNNALKYSEHTIRLVLTQDDDTFTIKVISDGLKISPDERARIFQPFYQTPSSKGAKNGVGIGLSLALSLATLLEGNLILEDNPDSLNIFSLILPKSESATVVKPKTETELEIENFMVKDEHTKSSHNVYSVLLVEDNTSILQFLSEQLRQDFLVETASNGQEALAKLGNNHFDIIVTDIMMPIMDGLELCQHIKDDINTSHIPVIFITAKNDLDSKIKGLKYGAEAYIEKPFSIKYLKQQIITLLDNRKRERDSFSKNPFFSTDNLQMDKNDEEFMNMVRAIIEENVSDENFNVESMCSILCMSRSSLLRKIKSLFNLSPVELIRLIKLKRAVELIQSGKYLIGDIGEMVGFSSPSYFSKTFQKQFGVTPKEFEKQCRTKNQSNINSNSDEP